MLIELTEAEKSCIKKMLDEVNNLPSRLDEEFFKIRRCLKAQFNPRTLNPETLDIPLTTKEKLGVLVYAYLREHKTRPYDREVSQEAIRLVNLYMEDLQR